MVTNEEEPSGGDFPAPTLYTDQGLLWVGHFWASHPPRLPPSSPPPSKSSPALPLPHLSAPPYCNHPALHPQHPIPVLSHRSCSQPGCPASRPQAPPRPSDTPQRPAQTGLSFPLLLILGLPQTHPRYPFLQTPDELDASPHPLFPPLPRAPPPSLVAPLHSLFRPTTTVIVTEYSVTVA